MFIDQAKTLRLLEKYKIPVPKYCIVSSKSKLIEKSKTLAVPLVLKLLSKKSPNKSEISAVRLDIKDKNALPHIFDEVSKFAKNKNKKFKAEAILVQEHKDGFDIFMDFKKDSKFGTVLYFGHLQTSLRILPIDPAEFTELLKESLSENEFKKLNQKELYSTVLKVEKLFQENKGVIRVLLDPVKSSHEKLFVVDAKVEENA